MLWKKESEQPNALYIDILAKSKLDLEAVFKSIISDEENTPHPRKDDVIALQKRNDGNVAFRRSAYANAMELYNDSLRFANPGSEHISLAYANRSACFLKLAMFEKCLNDIKLAEEAGYPEHLMPKMKQRKAECLERFAEGLDLRHSSIGKELSFEPDENFLYIANILKVQTDATGGSTVIAKKDIDVGQTIVVEDAMFPYLYKRFGLKCNICLKGYENLVPCKNCAVALFCADCQGHFLHEYECGLNMCGAGVKNNECLNDVRTVLLTIKMFPTIDEHMAFIERIRKNKNLPTNLTNRIYFNNSSLREGVFLTDIRLMAMKIYVVYRTILQVPQIKAMFQSRKHLRFLAHLIGQITSILKSTIETVGSSVNLRIEGDFGSYVIGDASTKLIHEFHPMLKYFQHSCYPNVVRAGTSSSMALTASRPIKQGEQVFYTSIPIDIEPASKRQMYLSKCECQRCKSAIASPEQRQQLSSEPAFIELLGNRHTSGTSQTKDQVEKSIEKCTILLRKYGHYYRRIRIACIDYKCNNCYTLCNVQLQTIYTQILSKMYYKSNRKSINSKQDFLLSVTNN